ncbi:MAG: DNA-methyltransferase, partial [Promethearchaeota archaeon]
MKSIHRVFFKNSNSMKEISSKSVDLVVTSPPYPLVELWDELFSTMNPEIKEALKTHNGLLAFELMHQELDKVWKEVYRVLKIGGIACINVGDAVRTIGKDFRLYSNHSRILNFYLKLGFNVLPEIIWRKPTNAPNKFMGSGMLPPNAYITLEHEFILILRKEGKRGFKKDTEKLNRQESAYFWEERNTWFSDLWNLPGISQELLNNEARKRSAAFTFELAYRLVNMFSVKDDIVLDPFLGTGTTTLAAICSERNSVGYELDPSFKSIINKRIGNSVEFANTLIKERLQKHETFVKKRIANDKPLKYMNKVHHFPVKTQQEINIAINSIKYIEE